MTERAEKLLAFLHTTRDLSLDEVSEDEQVDRLLDTLDDMLDLASLGSLARNLYGQAPRPSPYQEECNELLEGVDVCRLSTLLLIALVRLTASKKAHLPAWNRLCELAVVEIRVREPERWETLMCGLYDKARVS